MPEKVAELTKLHDAWLAGLPEPIQAGAKRYGMTPPAGAAKKKPKAERKKNKGAPPLQSPAAVEVKGAVRESFATVPAKPWKAQRGGWEAKDGAIWASLSPENKDAMLRGPAVFRSGTLSCEMKLTADSALMLRLRAPDGDMLLRTDIALDHLTISDVTGETNRILKKVPLKASPDAWHKLSLKFDGITLDGQFDDTRFAATDAIFDRDKGEVNFVMTAGRIGFRNFSIIPAEATK